MIESWDLEGKQGYWRSYIAEVPVQYLNIVMDDLKSFQFIVSRINAHAEVKACVSVLFTGIQSGINVTIHMKNIFKHLTFIWLLTVRNEVFITIIQKDSTPLVHNSVTLPVNKIAQLRASRQYERTYFFDYLLNESKYMWLSSCTPWNAYSAR